MGTDLEFQFSPLCPSTGRLDYEKFAQLIQTHNHEISAFVFPQVNSLGLLEEVDLLTNLASEHSIPTIAVIDPMHLVSGGLKPPTHFGEQGADFIAGEAQHLAIPPSFGGPGLGLFGCRHNDHVKKDLRNTPGRYIGRANDTQGRDCFVMVLSTREQHIRKEKPPQMFVLIKHSSQPLQVPIYWPREKMVSKTLSLLLFRCGIRWLNGLASGKGDLAFPESPGFNDLLISIDKENDTLISEARSFGLQFAVKVSHRLPSVGKSLLQTKFFRHPR